MLLRLKSLFRKKNTPEHESKTLGKSYEKYNLIREANHHSEKDSVS